MRGGCRLPACLCVHLAGCGCVGGGDDSNDDVETRHVTLLLFLDAAKLLFHPLPTTLTIPPTQPPHPDGENEAASSNGGLDLAKLFTPPSTKAPFGGLAQQLSSFFDKLLSPDGKAANKQPRPPPQQQKGGRPKRRTGGPVSVVFGATGRAGREVVTALLAAGHDVVAVRERARLLALCGIRSDGRRHTCAIDRSMTHSILRAPPFLSFAPS